LIPLLLKAVVEMIQQLPFVLGWKMLDRELDLPKCAHESLWAGSNGVDSF
jgi:hypothetical protein